MTTRSPLGQALADVSAALGPRVVGVGSGWGLGSGFVVADGRVVTNAHNLGQAGEARIRFADGREVGGAVAAADLDGDLAVLTADTGEHPALEWTPGPAEIGLPVVALANPGGRGLRATAGFVSGTERTFRGPRGRRNRGAIEHTAPMGRGSSGGPLLDADGRLVGVNTHRLGDGFYLAQPADQALSERLDALARGEAPQRLRLGIALAPDRAAHRLRAAVGLPERAGVLVHAVEAGGPAARAGLRRGDLLVAVDDRPLTGADELLDALAEHSAGAPVRLAVVRGTEELALEILPEGAS
jgi:serine protease Do